MLAMEYLNEWTHLFISKIRSLRIAELKQKHIAQSSKCLQQKKRILTPIKTSLGIKKNLLYGWEMWTLGTEDERKLNSLKKIQGYKRMMKMKQADNLTNEEVLKRMGEEGSLLKYIVNRRGQLPGHLVRRHELLLKTIIERQVNGKR